MSPKTLSALYNSFLKNRFGVYVNPLETSKYEPDGDGVTRGQLPGRITKIEQATLTQRGFEQ